MHAVCLSHAEVIDRYFKLYPERIRSQELVYEAAHLIKEAERLIGESQDLRAGGQGDHGSRDD